MSAPYTYVTDRLCVVLSGVWWCNSDPDFDPAQAVPVYPGGFVRRLAGTPQYDGARADAAESAVIAVSGAVGWGRRGSTRPSPYFGVGNSRRRRLRDLLRPPP